MGASVDLPLRYRHCGPNPQSKYSMTEIKLSTRDFVRKKVRKNVFWACRVKVKEL